jgi:hypothetical protein
MRQLPRTAVIPHWLQAAKEQVATLDPIRTSIDGNFLYHRVQCMLAAVLATGRNISGVAQMQLRHLGTDGLHDPPLEGNGFEPSVPGVTELSRSPPFDLSGTYPIGNRKAQAVSCGKKLM